MHAHLRNDVHVVKFAPPLIEIRSEGKAPSDLVKQLTALLNEHSAKPWTILLSDSQGVSTLAEQQASQTQQDLKRLTCQPLIRGILELFPGAKLEEFVNQQLDEYGLYPESMKIETKDEESSLVDENEYDKTSDEYI